MSDKIMNFNLNGAGIIEASAGTGKTYTITGLICRLLLGIGTGNGEPVDYSKILVMTFTKAATSDMKRKIGERIRELRCYMETLLRQVYTEPEKFASVISASCVDDKDPPLVLTMVRAYLNNGQDSQDELLKRLVKGIRILNRVELNMDNMQISTIHSFCRQIITKFVVDTGLSWQLNLMKNDRDLRKKALYECIRREMVTKARANDSGYLNIYNKFMGKDFDNLVSIFEKYKDDREIKLFNEKSFSEYGRLHEMLCQAYDIYEKLKTEERVINNDDLLLKLRDALVPGDGDSDEVITRKKFLARKIKQLFPVAIIDEFQDTDPVQFDIVRTIYLTPEGDGEAVTSDGKSFWGFYIVGDPKQSIYGFRDADLYCYTKAKNIIRNFYSDDERSQHEIELSVNYRSDANVVMAVNCLFSGKIPEELKEGEKITNGHFYDSLLKSGNGGVSADDENVQVDVNNDLSFTSVGFQEKQKYIYVIPEECRGAGKKVSANGGKEMSGSTVIYPYAACSFVKTKTPEPTVKKSGNSKIFGKKLYNPEVADECADLVVQLLNYGRISECKELTLNALLDDSKTSEVCRKITLKDITVLIGDKTEAVFVLKSLRARNVPVVYLSDRTKIYDTDEFNFFNLLMNAVISNSEQDYLRLLLASRVFSLSGREYSAAVCNHPVPLEVRQDESLKAGDTEVTSARVSGISMETLNDVLVECKQIWHDHGFMAMFTHFLERFNLLERIRNRSNGAEIITNLLHCSEIILNLSTRISDFRELIENYNNLKINSTEEEGDDGAKRLTDDNDEIVRITTYHSSKGLEYNIVLMPYADTDKDESRTNFNSKIIRIRDFAGDSEPGSKTEDAVSYHLVTSKKDPVWKNHCYEEKLEKHRLWYVALTRACHALFLWYTPRIEDKMANKKFCINRLIFDDVFGNGSDRTLFNIYGSPSCKSPYFRFINDYAEGLLDKRSPKDLDYYYSKDEDKTDTDTGYSANLLDADAINTRWKVFSYSSLVSGMGHASMAGRFTGKDNDNSDQTSDEEHTVKKLNERKECRFTFPKGSRAGTFLHDVLEHLDFQTAYDDLLTVRNGRTSEDFLKSEDAEETVIYKVLENKLRSNGFSSERKRILDLIGWFEEILTADLCIGQNDADGNQKYTSLKDLEDGDCIKEMEFWLKVSAGFNISDFNRLVNEIDCRGSEHPLAGVSDVQAEAGADAGSKAQGEGGKTTRLPEVTVEDINGLLTGFIDLIFKADGRYYVADYKSNYINDDIADYDCSNVRANMINHHYYIQYILYTLALHRYLKLHMPDYDYDRHVGGIAYLYLRGMKAPSQKDGNRFRGYGIFANRITGEYIERLDALFS
ncbi:MAG: UvrD-helicase domain-containing protein [Ruminobacter sp.]|nr:UvrD-helicase domain-containing protein [Ruminobacter sp.]